MSHPWLPADCKIDHHVLNRRKKTFLAKPNEKGCPSIGICLIGSLHPIPIPHPTTRKDSRLQYTTFTIHMTTGTFKKLTLDPVWWV
jgi:hypothetical protein